MSQTVLTEKPTIEATAEAPTVPQPDWGTRAGMLAWPTIFLTLGGAIVYGLSTWAGLTGWLALPLAVLLNFFMAYIAFTPLHDASHGSIRGSRHHLTWLETALGWIAGFQLAVPFPAFRLLHLRHHGYTNDPDMDPDYWVARPKLHQAILGCLTIMPHYLACYLGNPSKAMEKGRNFLLGVLFLYLTLPLWVGLIAGPAWGIKVALLHTVPAWLALAVLAFLFDYLPHMPFQNRERFYDTRIMLYRACGVLTMGQAYHLVHHLWPRIPFYHYGTFFWEAQEFLEAKGCEISDYRNLAKRPSED